MLTDLWNDPNHHDDLNLNECLIDAANCVVALTESIEVNDFKLNKMLKMIDSIRNGVGYITELPDGINKVAHTKRVVTHLKHLEVFINELLSMNKLKEDKKTIDIPSYFKYNKKHPYSMGRGYYMPVDTDHQDDTSDNDSFMSFEGGFDGGDGGGGE
jgi:Mor family transcriptional regulator